MTLFIITFKTILESKGESTRPCLTPTRSKGVHLNFFPSDFDWVLDFKEHYFRPSLICSNIRSIIICYTLEYLSNNFIDFFQLPFDCYSKLERRRKPSHKCKFSSGVVTWDTNTIYKYKRIWDVKNCKYKCTRVLRKIQPKSPLEN